MSRRTAKILSYVSIVAVLSLLSWHGWVKYERANIVNESDSAPADLKDTDQTEVYWTESQNGTLTSYTLLMRVREQNEIVLTKLSSGDSVRVDSPQALVHGPLFCYAYTTGYNNQSERLVVRIFKCDNPNRELHSVDLLLKDHMTGPYLGVEGGITALSSNGDAWIIKLAVRGFGVRLLLPMASAAKVKELESWQKLQLRIDVDRSGKVRVRKDGLTHGKLGL